MWRRIFYQEHRYLVCIYLGTRSSKVIQNIGKLYSAKGYDRVVDEIRNWCEHLLMRMVL